MRLSTAVIVDGEVYERGTTPPDDVAERITNPAAWDAPDDAPDVPDGSAAQVEEWVGDDPKRARRALAAEAEREGGPRSTLVARLERIE